MGTTVEMLYKHYSQEIRELRAVRSSGYRKQLNFDQNSSRQPGMIVGWFPDGNPHKFPLDGTSTDWAPPSLPTHPSVTATIVSHTRVGTGEPQQPPGRRIVPSNL